VIFSEKKFDENSQLFRRPHAKFTIEKKIRRNASRYSDDSSSGLLSQAFKRVYLRALEIRSFMTVPIPTFAKQFRSYVQCIVFV
jgi:hypothetical protein